MKAEIRADGRLFITAETELESYALRKWVSENIPPAATGHSVWNNNAQFILDPQDSDQRDDLDQRPPAAVIAAIVDLLREARSKTTDADLGKRIDLTMRRIKVKG